MDYIEDTFFYEEEPAHWVALSSWLALLAPRVRCSPLGSLCSPQGSPWGAGGLGLCTGAASQLLRPLMLGFRGDQSHNSGRPLPMVVNKRSQEKEKDKHGDVSSQYVPYSMKCPREE